MSDEKIISLDERREQKERANFAEAVADDLGVTTEGLAELTGGSVEGIQDALLASVERQMVYHAYEERDKERERAKGLDPDTCCNMPCAECVQFEHEHANPDTGELTFSGREYFCKKGMAQGCIFRLLEHPYADPFVDIPSHNECVRILQRIGYVRGSSFEEELGTNFMLHKATSKLWKAYVRLLIETDRVTLPSDELKNMEHLEEDHAKFCLGQDDAHEYFRNTELPDTIATVGELVAQRNALLAFIRGEIDWPDGRCPCGEDVNWDGVAHTPDCRFNPLRSTTTGRFKSDAPNESSKPGWIVTCSGCDCRYNGTDQFLCPDCGTPRKQEVGEVTGDADV